MTTIGTGPQFSLNSTHAAERTGPSEDASRVGTSFRPMQSRFSDRHGAGPQPVAKPLESRQVSMSADPA